DLGLSSRHSLSQTKSESLSQMIFTAVAAQLCARGPGQPTGYPDRQHGQDTDEPDELIAHVRDCGGAGRVTTGSTRHLTAARLRFGMNPKGPGWAAAGDRER